jgi:hypothetical protein
MIFVFNEGANTNVSTDDSWSQYTIASVQTEVGGCPATSGFTAAADATKDSYRINLATNVDANIRTGAPIRFWRPVTYVLFRNSSDQKSYLGYCSPVCSPTNPATPAAGPFLPYNAASGTNSGIRITYFDGTGATTATPTSVARISIVLRAQTAGLVTTSGSSKRAAYMDSLRVNVAIRNRS